MVGRSYLLSISHPLSRVFMGSGSLSARPICLSSLSGGGLISLLTVVHTSLFLCLGGNHVFSYKPTVRSRKCVIAPFMYFMPLAYVPPNRDCNASLISLVTGNKNKIKIQ